LLIGKIGEGVVVAARQFIPPQQKNPRRETEVAITGLGHGVG